MFSLVKQMFVVLLSFISSLATKCLSLVRSAVFNLNHVKLKYYSFMISLDKCSGRFPIPKKML